jgi:hypothetical protein
MFSLSLELLKKAWSITMHGLKKAWSITMHGKNPMNKRYIGITMHVKYQMSLDHHWLLRNIMWSIVITCYFKIDISELFGWHAPAMTTHVLICNYICRILQRLYDGLTKSINRRLIMTQRLSRKYAVAKIRRRWRWFALNVDRVSITFELAYMAMTFKRVDRIWLKKQAWLNKGGVA